MKEVNRISHSPESGQITRIIYSGENWNTFLRNLDFGQYENNIPLELMEQMFKDLENISIIRRHSFGLKTSKNIISLPCDVKCDYDISWTSDENRVDSDKWVKIDIPTYTLNATMILTYELIEDTDINVEEIVYKRIISRITQVENHAFLYGDGKSKPTGLLHDLGKVKKIEIKIEDLDLELLAKTYMDLNPAFQQNAVWLVNKKLFNFLINYEKKNLFLTVPSSSNPISPMMFLNCPLYVIDQLHEDHLAVIGDLSQSYCVVDRAELTVLKDPYSKKPDIEFYFSKRVGGMPMNFNSYKLIENKHSD